MDCLPDWSEILPELLVEIALRLPLFEDFTAFRGVCTNWRAAGAAKAELFKGLGKVPLLMLSEEDDSDNDEREFYSLSKMKIFNSMPVPGAKGKKCIEVGFGWILAVTDDDSGGNEVSLFNHFCSAANIELPNTRTFPIFPDEFPGEENGEPIERPKDHFIQRAVLSANPLLTSNFTVFVAVDFSLGFWRNGDKSWTTLNTHRGPYLCGGICYFKEKMYYVDILGQIFAWDPYGTDPIARMVLRLDEQRLDEQLNTEDGRMPYLVESSDGELLMIVRNNTEPNFYFETGATRFEVMRVDLVKKEIKQIEGIGKDAVFLGDNAPVSVAAADFPGVLKPNCIYFTDDNFFCYRMCDEGGGLDMGVYNVEDGSIERFEDGSIERFEDGSIERFEVESLSHVCPPLWIFPSF